MKITLPKERPMSWNKPWAGMHWALRKRETDRVHDLIFYSLKPLNLIPLLNRIDVIITVYFENRPFDADNICMKPYIDGMKKIAIAGDHPRQVRSAKAVSEIDKENPRLEIELVEILD